MVSYLIRQFKGTVCKTGAKLSKAVNFLGTWDLWCINYTVENNMIIFGKMWKEVVVACLRYHSSICLY